MGIVRLVIKDGKMLIAIEPRENRELKKHFYGYLNDLYPYENHKNLCSKRQSWKAMLDQRVMKFWIVNEDFDKQGFVFMCWMDTFWEIAQFYVFKPYRRNFVGTNAFIEIKNMFKGNIELEVLKGNPAINFWNKFYSEYKGYDAESNCERYVV